MEPHNSILAKIRGARFAPPMGAMPPPLLYSESCAAWDCSEPAHLSCGVGLQCDSLHLICISFLAHLVDLSRFIDNCCLTTSSTNRQLQLIGQFLPLGCCINKQVSKTIHDMIVFHCPDQQDDVRFTLYSSSSFPLAFPVIWLQESGVEAFPLHANAQLSYLSIKCGT